MIRLYITPTCPRCHRLADFFQLRGIEFYEEPLDAGAATEYICATGKPALAAPILQVEEEWYGPDTLFQNGELDIRILQEILGME